MKTQISRHSYNPEKRFSGVFQQQGRMLTDADWNELVHILNERIAAGFRDVVGAGTPKGRPISVSRDAGTGDPVLSSGVVHVGGQAVESRSSYRYTVQPELPGAPGPAVEGDTLYLDVWERTVLPLEDPALVDPGLHGADTCSRTQVVLQLKRAPQAAAFPPPRSGDAQLELYLRAARSGSGEPAGLTPGNFVFRLEVHDVQGDPRNPTRLTLKWSTENAAEAYGNDYRLPEHFKGNDFLYEFFNSTTERHLGVQLVTGPGFPLRSRLDRGFPASPPTQGDFGLVRRWDGMCELSRDGAGVWSLVSGWDRGSALTAVTTAPARHGDLRIDSTGKVLVLLQELDLHLPLKVTAAQSRTFVPGDYWLATVREDDAPGTRVLQPTGPVGIVHHYLKLGTYRSNRIDAEPNLQFPTLTGLSVSGAGAAGDGLIGSDAKAGTPRNLPEGTVASQLKKLIDYLNEHVQATSKDHDERYYTKTESDGRFVSSIATGLGLTGGPISSTGTIAIDTTVVPRLTVANTFSAANTFSHTGNSFTGNGAGLTSLNAGSLGSGTVPSARISGAYTNITSVGTLTGLNVSGDMDGAHSLMKRLTLGASTINASFQGTVDTQLNGTINKGDGYLELRTSASSGSYAEVRSNAGPYGWDTQVRGSFISVLANLSYVHQSGHVAYITFGGAKGNGSNSGGFGFKCTHNGSARILSGVIYGLDGFERGAAVLDANFQQGMVRLFAIHRGDTIEFYKNGVWSGSVPTTHMSVGTFPLYFVRLENGPQTQTANIGLSFLTLGTPMFL
jgi:hypothetical protein